MASFTDDGFPVHIGPWINWTYGFYRGAVLTLTQSSGALLTAFLALFITYAGSQLWRILCLALSLALSTNGTPEDAVYHQRQAIFRNASNGADGLWNLIQLFGAWRTRTPRLWTRLSPFIAICGIYWAAFTAASIFSARITSTVGDEVLVSSAHCGQPDGQMYLMRGPLGGQPFSRFLFSTHFNRLLISRQYAAECYQSLFNRQAGSTCNVFAKKNLTFSINYNASCPVDPIRCATQDQNVVAEARINSHDDLGLNSPPSRRLDTIWTVHCAPLNTSGLEQPQNHTTSTSTVNYLKYYLGTVGYLNGQQVNHTWRSSVPDFEQFDVSSGSPSLRSRFYHSLSGSALSASTSWYPIQTLQQNDSSDLTIIILTHNGMVSLNSTDDPWYSSHGRVRSGNQTSGSLPQYYYFADRPTSFLYCKEQFRTCEPGAATSDSRRCSPPASLSDAYASELMRTAGKPSVLLRLFQAFSVHSMGQIPHWLGSSSFLTERAGTSVSSLIPDDQWKWDVVFWLQQFLASVQGSMVDIAVGVPPSADLSEWWHVANTTDEKQFCHSQKIRSPSHTNFSIFWLSVILVLGCLVICIQWALEPLIVQLDKRSKQRKYSLLEWKSNETLQLQRLAHEAVGSGTWSNCAGGIPTTERGETLASFDMDDFARHRLKDPTRMTGRTPAQQKASLGIEGDKNASGSTAAVVKDPTQDPSVSHVTGSTSLLSLGSLGESLSVSVQNASDHGSGTTSRSSDTTSQKIPTI